ncbi:ExbD/TolR family protein [Kushneria phosphatilytica]|uniref:Biopolymer transporter ExbD n=1 Tax=Kushneria phosphatilytica TaxID=657387 RepID=A0A1S1NRG2_9GAMM|nr:biopolymer transporter ExbD [Kushneria phosphatilytica]OHV11819.1 biopolymer transporter ExbD [Kushneria phosphatilytica]QEL10984.1 biopolymer transporter ExbD [Kushneria phosphatilytica]
MRRRRRLQEEEAGIDLTPMLDVVFIMLIFFIVTTSFVKESGVDIQRPQASSASARPDAQVMVAITPEGAIWVNGEAVDADRVGEAVSHAMADSSGSVVIQADRQSRTGLLIRTMDRIRQAGVDNIAVAASQGDS